MSDTPQPPQEQFTIDLVDLTVIKELIEHSAQRGLIHPKSFVAVGNTYQKIEGIIASIQKS